MSVNHAYNYAEIDDDNMCVGAYSCTVPSTNPRWIAIPVNDPEYCMKYYINGNWYVDSAGTTQWTSALL